MGVCIVCGVDGGQLFREVGHHMQTHALHLMVPGSTRQAKPAAVRKPAVKAKRMAKKPAVTKDPVTITYRPRTAADDDFIVSLTKSELGDVHQKAFGQPFPEEQFRTYIQSGAPTFVIERNGKPIGYYSYLTSYDGKMHISAMVIQPRYQRAGIGKAAIAKIEEDARRMGIHTLEVFVQDNNEQSLAFTRSLGFQEVFRFEPHTIAFHKVIAQSVAPGFGTGMPPMGMPQF